MVNSIEYENHIFPQLNHKTGALSVVGDRETKLENQFLMFYTSDAILRWHLYLAPAKVYGSKLKTAECCLMSKAKDFFHNSEFLILLDAVNFSGTQARLSFNPELNRVLAHADELLDCLRRTRYMLKVDLEHRLDVQEKVATEKTERQPRKQNPSPKCKSSLKMRKS